ncbi:unnamed protein product [Ilex paraguariensis]|uniref:Cupin type-1 domain-containing protein n=1 Tax=Ilex paraguariensis TaxID=185542 RepID=A0ABC8RPX3_9AQUA
MAIKVRLPLFCFLLFTLLLVFVTAVLGKEDPELRQCKQQCQRQEGFDKSQRRQCEQGCELSYREKERREREQEGSRGGDRDEKWNPQSPEERLRQCVRTCEQREEQQRPQCRQRCEEEYKQEREREERGGQGNAKDPQMEYKKCQRKCEKKSEKPYKQQQCESRCVEKRREQERKREKECEKELERECKREQKREYERAGEKEGERAGERAGEQEGERERERGEAREGNPQHDGEEDERREQWENPYVFEEQHFTSGIQTEHGRDRVLQKFTERSELLRGIENYRIAILEAEPQAFVVPHHKDAEAVIFVANGKGSITLVLEEKRESFNLRYGDILRISAGITVHITNRDKTQRLVIAKLLQPVSIPGQLETFFGVGGENPGSFYRAFSTDILEAALKTNRDKIQRLLGKQSQGMIVKASEEQIRGLSTQEKGGESSRGPLNLFEKRPSKSNDYGQLYEVDERDYGKLEDLDVAVSFANITRGSMETPFYNSRATKIAVVIDGEGYYEMACPHLGSQRGEQQKGQPGRRAESEGQRKGGPRYQRVSARLRRGTVFVAPASHPIVIVASNNRNLQVLCFEVNARNNEKYPLAGKRNVINQLEKEAKELGFSAAEKEVDEVFKSQDEDFFFNGPRQQQDEGRSDA